MATADLGQWQRAKPENPAETLHAILAAHWRSVQCNSGRSCSVASTLLKATPVWLDINPNDTMNLHQGKKAELMRVSGYQTRAGRAVTNESISHP